MANSHSTLFSLFSDIADSIRSKTGSSSRIVADDFPQAIAEIPTGITPTGNINITTMDTVDVTNYASAKVVDSDLIASNILSGVNILGVSGSVVINKYYTGSSDPSSSLGNNGDIYLKV